VLIVDEDIGFRAVLGARLEQLDLDVDHALDYQGAIKKLIKHDYDLILCDSKRVPGQMHGGHVKRWIDEMRLGVPVHFLEKPVDVQSVTSFVRGIRTLFS
jgi:DNA-binding NtrC family response regulator